MKKIAAIVVTYNRCALLLECIEALKKYAKQADIIIVDNASTDATKENIQLYIKNEEIVYYNTGSNIGGAGGFNYGIKKAYNLGYEYFWLMDDDTIINKYTLKEIINCVRITQNRFGFISSLALWTDGSICKMNRHIINNKWGDSKSYCKDGILRIDQATFVSFFIKREVVAKVGLPIKDYFIWGDDTEYSLRISKAYPCYFAAKSVVTHKMKENKSTARMYQLKDKERIDRMYLSIRNDMCTYKHYSLIKLLEVSLYFFMNLVLVIIKKNPYKLKKIKVILRGFFDGLLFFDPEIEKFD